MKAANKVLSVAGAAVGVAAAGTALRVAQRRAVIARRGAGDETEFKSLRSAPITVVADDGVPLHVEVDELRRHRSTARDQGAGADRGVHPRLLADPRLLALPARGLPRAGALGLLRPALPRPLRALGRRVTRPSSSWATTSSTSSTPWSRTGPIVLVGHSMGGMTIMALAEEYPELFGDRIVGVGLISTTAGGLEPHRIVAPMLPSTLGGAVAERLMARPGARAPAGRRLPASGPLGGDGGHRRARLRRRRARVVRRVRRRDALVHAVRGGRRVLLQLRHARQVRDRQGALGGADEHHLRDGRQDHLDRPQPQAPCLHRRLEPARVPGRRAPRDHGAARRRQRRARPPVRRGR